MFTVRTWQAAVRLDDAGPLRICAIQTFLRVQHGTAAPHRLAVVWLYEDAKLDADVLDRERVSRRKGKTPTDATLSHEVASAKLLDDKTLSIQHAWAKHRLGVVRFLKPIMRSEGVWELLGGERCVVVPIACLQRRLLVTPLPCTTGVELAHVQWCNSHAEHPFKGNSAALIAESRKGVVVSSAM